MERHRQPYSPYLQFIEEYGPHMRPQATICSIVPPTLLKLDSTFHRFA